jgi:hypothetical protein
MHGPPQRLCRMDYVRTNRRSRVASESSAGSLRGAAMLRDASRAVFPYSRLKLATEPRHSRVRAHHAQIHVLGAEIL